MYINTKRNRPSQTPKEPTRPTSPINCVLLSYFETGRRLKVRSLLLANEELETEPDAKRANKTNLTDKLCIVELFLDWSKVESPQFAVGK